MWGRAGRGDARRARYAGTLLVRGYMRERQFRSLSLSLSLALSVSRSRRRPGPALMSQLSHALRQFRIEFIACSEIVLR